MIQSGLKGDGTRTSDEADSAAASQSSPKSSAGCGVRIEPLPHPRSAALQWRSQPQQIRSGCFGCSSADVMAHSILRRSSSPIHFTVRVPFMPLRKWPGKLQRNVYTPGAAGALNVTSTVSPAPARGVEANTFAFMAGAM